MFGKVKWKKYGKYSGPQILGKCPNTFTKTYWERVLWLTSQVETGGMLDTVIGYDKTLSGGLVQYTSIYPLINKQGRLWDFIKNLPPSVSNPFVDQLNSELNWIISDEGYLVNKTDLTLITMDEIVYEFNPPNGTVPSFGDHWNIAKTWALLLNQVLSNPDGFSMHVQFIIRDFMSNDKRKFNPLKNLTVNEIMTKYLISDKARNQVVEIASAMFWSYFVNNPQKACTILRRVYDMKPCIGYDDLNFAKKLINEFFISTSKNWDANNPQGRYQRTKKAVQSLWKETLKEYPNLLL